jgi:pectin methylesterase-like acyl-CoA thioesterase
MTDPVARRFNTAEYLKSMGPITGTPRPVRLSTTQRPAEIAALRAEFAAHDSAQAENTAAFIKSTTPRVDNVAAMRPEEAQARLDQLTALKTVGGFHRIGANAINGDQKTTSVDTFMEWLKARAGDKPAASAISPPPLFDVTA